MTPKISVLIPMYNRKHYIEQCIGSVLNRTFQDFEIIVRDDGSKDGSADFVAQRYAAEISAGKIKLRRNEKNLGENPNVIKLILDSTGKYFAVLHSDDMYLPHALEHLCAVAEHFKADVVHSTIHVATAPDGVINPGKPLMLSQHDGHRVDKVALMSDNSLARFNHWAEGGTFIDAQYNLFRREFLTDNELFFGVGGNRTFAMRWIMKAKIFVKTPQPFYIYRNSPDSVTRAAFPPERVKSFIIGQIKLSRWLDDYFAKDEFFRDNEECRYRARAHLFTAYDSHWIKHNRAYGDGISLELNHAVEEAFKKFFGDDATFPTFLFHWAHCLQSNSAVNVINPPTALTAA